MIKAIWVKDDDLSLCLLTCLIQDRCKMYWSFSCLSCCAARWQHIFTPPKSIVSQVLYFSGINIMPGTSQMTELKSWNCMHVIMAFSQFFSPKALWHLSVKHGSVCETPPCSNPQNTGILTKACWTAKYQYFFCAYAEIVILHSRGLK